MCYTQATTVKERVIRRELSGIRHSMVALQKKKFNSRYFNNTEKRRMENYELLKVKLSLKMNELRNLVSPKRFSDYLNHIEQIAARKNK